MSSILINKINSNSSIKTNISAINVIGIDNVLDISNFIKDISQNTVEIDLNLDINTIIKKLQKDDKTILQYFPSINNTNKDPEVLKKSANKLLKAIDSFLLEIKKIRTNTNIKFDEKGIWYCYIGYETIKTKIEEKEIEVPLLFKTCRITLDRNYITLTIGDKVIKNEKIISYLNFNYPNNIINIDSLSSNKEIIKEINQLLSVVKQSDKESTEEIKPCELLVAKAKIYLGIFDPEESKLKKEIIKIANSNVDLYATQNCKGKLFYSKQEFDDNPLLVINNPLNFYQKIACRSAINENTIIYGPPGTGKSEIIVNIIANAVINEKSLLVVSEKRTALDVLVDRLKEINDLSLFLTNIKDEASVYYKINKIQERLGSFWEIEKAEKFNLKEVLYKVNSIESFSERTKKFYKVINEKVSSELKLDTILKNDLNDISEIDYKSYLVIKNKLMSKIEPSFLELLTRYKDKLLHSDESIWLLIERIANYNHFYKKFVVKHGEVMEYFGILENFNRIKSRSLFSERIILEESFNDRFKKFFALMKSINLDNDKKFRDIFLKDPTIFEQQISVFEGLFKKYPEAMSDKKFQKFLINMHQKHDEFVKSFSKTANAYKYIAIETYLETGKIKKTGNIFKQKKLNKELLEEKKNCIFEVNNLILPKNSTYLLNVNEDLWKYMTCDLVYFYIDNDVKKEEIKYMIDHQLILVPEELSKAFEQSKMFLEIDDIKKICLFEKTRFKLIQNIDETFNQSIIDYTIENSQSCEFIPGEIYDKYVEYLKTILINSPPEFKMLAKEMFQVSRVPDRMKLTTFISKYHDVLMKVLPIWVALPDQVAVYCKFEPKIFDIAVMDESSQMYMEDALPVIYRAKHTVASGDDKQLKPTAFFDKSSSPNIKIDHLEVLDFNIVESLLDRASVALWSGFSLRNHYRSNKQELIQFSNTSFYNNDLVFASINRDNSRSIEVFDVNGKFDEVNEKEAQKVVSELNKNLKLYKTILVITFSAKQADCIMKEISNSKNANDIFSKIENNEIIVKNLENCQGYEADCVILSISYGKNKKGILKNNFGPLNKKGGMNRLNVAITRSKEKMIIVKSLKASEMSVNNDNQDAKVFFNFILYLDGINKYYESITNVNINKKPDYLYGEELIEDLVPYLKQEKIEYTCNYKLGSKKIDIVLFKKDLNNIELLICLDFWSKYDEADELLADINGQEFLMTRGYKFVRVREIEWIQDKEIVLEHIKKIMGW